MFRLVGALEIKNSVRKGTAPRRSFRPVIQRSENVRSSITSGPRDLIMLDGFDGWLLGTGQHRLPSENDSGF